MGDGDVRKKSRMLEIVRSAHGEKNNVEIFDFFDSLVKS